MFSEEHSFSRTQLVKRTFPPMSKNTFFKNKCHFWFWTISAETANLIVFPGFHFFGPKRKKSWPKQIVHTKNSQSFSLPDTNSVRQFLLIIHFFIFHFWMTSSTKTQFYSFGACFHFVVFLCSVSLSPT